MTSRSILIISATSISVLLLISIVFAVTVYSAPTSSTGSIEKVSSNGISCHDKILGYARIGAYQDKETFNAALSSCSTPSGI
ncbi:MAG: hypothetical protein WBM37_03135 [Nitrososphaeraceae archaeon]